MTFGTTGVMAITARYTAADTVTAANDSGGERFAVFAFNGSTVTQIGGGTGTSSPGTPVGPASLAFAAGPTGPTGTVLLNGSAGGTALTDWAITYSTTSSH